MSLKHVERIRQRVVQGFVREFIRLRAFISMTEGNHEAVDILRGEEGNALIAELTDTTLRRLGHDAQSFNRVPSGETAPVESKASTVRREVARVRGKTPTDTEA